MNDHVLRLRQTHGEQKVVAADVPGDGLGGNPVQPVSATDLTGQLFRDTASVVFGEEHPIWRKRLRPTVRYQESAFKVRSWPNSARRGERLVLLPDAAPHLSKLCLSDAGSVFIGQHRRETHQCMPLAVPEIFNTLGC